MAFAVPAAAAVEPYGTNDAGGFRSVLPPGEKGVANAVDLAAFTLNGTYPKHWEDQQPLYDGLLYAAAKPDFGEAEVRQFFKDATFGVRSQEVESEISPRPGVTILRDEDFGVPHVYGETREDTMFGLGYVNAADRLFLMDVLRHTGRADLSSFIGGSASNRAMDHGQWQVAPYTNAELEAQAAQAPDLYGEQGVLLLADLDAYIAGINDYISDALLNPTLLPAEYAALGKLPQQWTRADVIATASLIGGIFGKGGGRELDSALTMKAFERRFGRRMGRRAWKGFRLRNDPEAPTTVRGRFPYQTGSAFAKRGLAIPRPASVERAPVAPPLTRADRAQSRTADPYGDIGGAIREAFSGPAHASHWELIPGSEAQTGDPIAVMGPQVGYYVPQVLMEIDAHGPGIDARGATFPGVGLYVLLGHGSDYAWSATTATSDNVDTFAEVLCKDDFHYRYRGECVAMEKLERHNSWTPNAVDMTLPGSETLTAYRTVHGIVHARGKVKGREVAFVTARSTYGHEADSALFFQRMNDPGFMEGGADAFHRAAKAMNFAFNWSYVDSDDIAYELTGWYPQRARRTSPDFPILGTGRFDWKGFNPATGAADWVPQRRHPHAVNPKMLVSWNNKQAPGWAAADDQYGYGPIYRVELLTDDIKRMTHGAKRLSLPELVQLQEQAATEDVRAHELLPLMLRAVGKPRDPDLRAAVATLRSWRNAGGFRRDLDKDGTYDHDAAVTLMDAWYPLLLEAEFRPRLGEEAFDALQGMLGFGAPGRGAPGAPAFSDGWYGYVSKDLRAVFGKRPRGALAGEYCGRGSKRRCRRAVRGSLREALSVPKAELYGYGDCASDPQASCWDLNRPTVASALDHGPYPFQNRPTFQQAVSIGH